MRLAVTLEHRFHLTPDGKLWSQTTFPYAFWSRYLDVFEHVNIIARALRVNSVPNDWKRVDGDSVSFTPVPYYVGPLQYLMKATQVRRSVRNGIGLNDAIIMRVGSTLADCLYPILRCKNRPYGVEVVADPYDVFAPGSVRHPLRPFMRIWLPHNLRCQCMNACAAAYVTKFALQRRYPAGVSTFSTYYSSVELPEVALSKTPRVFTEVRRLRLINIGTMAQMYKAQDILIDAVAICIKNGMDLTLIFVGDGRYRSQLENRAAIAGIDKRVYFLGQLRGGRVVRDQLDNADIFVLPSHQEGLPRAMIEAMARGLPCIGSSVGGIPELLSSEDIVPSCNAKTLAAKIQEVAINPQRMNEMSIRNLKKASEYQDHILIKRRREFYQSVKSQTENWLFLRGINEGK